MDLSANVLLCVSEVYYAVTYLGPDQWRIETFLRCEFLVVYEPNTRVNGATGEANGSSSIFVAGISSRIGNGISTEEILPPVQGGEPWRLVDATGLDTEPFDLASTQPSEGARGNLRRGINKGRVDTHAYEVAPQKILRFVNFAAYAGMYSKRGAWVHMACRGTNHCIDACRATARSAKVQPCLVLAL
jgi:hypothetical protein